MNNLFEIQSKILRMFGNLLGYRPASHPYISGDGFRAMAEYIYDETRKCAPDIREGGIVFVKTDFIHEWFRDVHPLIQHKYKLITHNSDNVISETEAGYIDSKIIRWFAQNNIFKHEKITPIPIGIENKRWFMSGWVLSRMVRKLKKVARKNRILFGFNVNTNTSERMQALEALRACPIADEIKGRLSPKQYFMLLNNYNFVASPEGNGPDTHRIWEAMIVGVIPVIKNSSQNQIFIQNTLPVVLLDNWRDAEQACSAYNSSLKSDITMAEYWKRIIKSA